MKIQEIHSLIVDLPSFQLRAGKALTVLQYAKDGVAAGNKDLVVRTEELDSLIEALTKVREFTQKE